MNLNNEHLLKKSEIRNNVKSYRSSLDSDEVDWLSREINERLIGFVDFSKIKTAHIYLQMAEKKEIKTSNIFEYIWQNFPEIKTASWEPKNNKYVARWRKNHEWQQTVKNSFQYDLIVVPMLAFNKRGHRVGYGRGFYDKFLAEQTRATVLGLCYEAGQIQNWQEDFHDIPMDVIITEEQIYQISC